MDDSGEGQATVVTPASAGSPGPAAGPSSTPAPAPAPPASAPSSAPASTPGAAPAAPPTAAPAPPARPPFRLGYRPELDGLRGLATIPVVSHHIVRLMWPTGDHWVFPGGQVGLDLFFALSGFLITALILGEFERTGRVDVVDFVRRRLRRLLPALLVMMACLLAVSVVGERYSPGVLLSSTGWVATFSTNLVFDRPIVELAHTWSLSVEAHFYLLWCLATALVVSRVRRPYPVLAGLAVGTVVVVAVTRALAYHDGVDVVGMYVATLRRLDGPLLGALAGIAVVAGWVDRVPRRWAVGACVAALAVLGVTAYRTTPISPVLFEGLFTAVAACGAVLVVAASLASGSRLHRFFTARPLVALGTISYSVYLWHFPIIMWFHRNIRGWPVAGKIAACVMGSLVAGVVSYALVERRFLRPKRAAAPA
ncbi:MAG TPA: acyltransferase [Acidimicrobiales bacterium]